jgi:formylglycine-generating enzyme
MRVYNHSAALTRGKRLEFWVLLLFVLGLAGAWRIGTAPSVWAQATTKVNSQDGLTYVWIPPGTFQMGCSPDDSGCSDDESPAHKVTLTRGFWIGQTPVTQAAYKKVAGSNPSNFKGDGLPVETVDWEDAQAYCSRVEMRLPTEAEYEYAARGGSLNARYAPADRMAWYYANSGRTTHEVGQKQVNGYGLYDMLGNVWEWVADWYGPYNAATAVDPKGPQTGQLRVLRGSSWDLDASVVRVSLRFRPGIGVHAGFRCAGN